MSNAETNPNMNLVSGNQNPNSGHSEGLSSIVRNAGDDVPDARVALVKELTENVRAAKKYWDKDFKRMRTCMDFLRGRQWEGQTEDDDERYVANLTLRHVNLRVSSIYAKNPTVVAQRRESMDFKIWDESPQSLQQATMVLQTAQQVMATGGIGHNGGPPMVDPAMAGMIGQAQALMADVQEGMARRTMLGRVARTLQLYFKNKVLSNQFPPFKISMKQLDRRVEACGVGYIQLDFMREMERSPDAIERITTVTEQLATIERLMAEMQDGDPVKTESDAEAEQLRLALQNLQSQQDVVTQEGIVFDFPRSTSIIPDPKTAHLHGWVGSDWVSREYLLTPDQVQEIWKVDVGKDYTAYCPSNDHWANYVPQNDGKHKKGLCCVWRIYSRKDGLVYTVVDGFKQFLEEPAAPKLKLERFYPWFVLAFNLTEHETSIFPLSDVWLLMGPQREHNRSRQGMREHRHANRPMTVARTGVLDDGDKAALQTRPANAVVELDGLMQGEKVGDVLQTYEGPKISAELYDVTPFYEDIQRTVGDQEANLGGTSGVTATESSIAEGSRVSSLQSNIDDQDEFLTEVMRSAGQVALTNIGAEEVTRVVGVGAVWPTLSGQEIADEVYLEVQAGSSGRPNKAAEIQNFTQMMPVLLQLPGINPIWLARQALTRLDDRLDLTEAIVEGLPSIQAMNATAGKSLGQPSQTEKDPKAQGSEGSRNVRPGDGTTARGGDLGAQQPNALPVGGMPMGNA